MDFRMKLMVFVPALLSLCVNTWAGTLYVHSRLAPLLAKPSLGAERVAELELGTRLEFDRQQPGWYHVIMNRNQGWISRMLVKKYPPQKANPVSARAEEHLAQRARIRPSALASTAAARGLRADRRRANLRLRADYQALAKMESYRVDQEQARIFLGQGWQDVKKP